MTIEERICQIYELLGKADYDCDQKDYDSALSSATKAYEQSRLLLEQLWRLKRQAALAANPPGENV